MSGYRVWIDDSLDFNSITNYSEFADKMNALELRIRPSDRNFFGLVSYAFPKNISGTNKFFQINWYLSDMGGRLPIERSIEHTITLINLSHIARDSDDHITAHLDLLIGSNTVQRREFMKYVNTEESIIAVRSNINKFEGLTQDWMSQSFSNTSELWEGSKTAIKIINMLGLDEDLYATTHVAEPKPPEEAEKRERESERKICHRKFELCKDPIIRPPDAVPKVGRDGREHLEWAAYFRKMKPCEDELTACVRRAKGGGKKKYKKRRKSKKKSKKSKKRRRHTKRSRAGKSSRAR